MNQLLMLLSLFLVVGFHSSGDSTEIVEVYGTALAILMTITTILYILVLRYSWHYPFWKIIPGFLFLGFDLFLLLGTLTEVHLDGWPPMALALFFGFIMLSWIKGRMLIKRYNQSNQFIFFRKECDAIEKRKSKNLDLTGCIVNDLEVTDDESDYATDLSETFQCNLDFDLKNVGRSRGMGIFISTSNEVIPEVFSNAIKYSSCAPGTSELYL